MHKKQIIIGFSLMLLVCGCDSKKPNYERPVEVRAVYLNTFNSNIFDSQRSIAEVMHFLGEHHFNAVFPAIRFDVKILYKFETGGGFLDKLIDSLYADRDPIAELVYEAHRQGLKVIPWIEYGSCSADEKSGGDVSDKYSHWFVKDTIDNVVNAAGFEWLNLCHPEVQDLIINLYKELINKYKIDGINGGTRLFSQPIQGGYSEYTRRLYADEHDTTAPPDDSRENEWQSWRNDKINRFVRRIYKEVKTIKPNIRVCWSANIYDETNSEILQDWPMWINGGYADIVFPLINQSEITQYEIVLYSQQPDSISLFRNTNRVIPGMFVNNDMSMEFLLKGLEYNRKTGYKGEVFFFYEGLRNNDDQAARMLRKTFYRQPARFPF